MRGLVLGGGRWLSRAPCSARASPSRPGALAGPGRRAPAPPASPARPRPAPPGSLARSSPVDPARIRDVFRFVDEAVRRPLERSPGPPALDGERAAALARPVLASSGWCDGRDG